jgi:hypothetical protein
MILGFLFEKDLLCEMTEHDEYVHNDMNDIKMIDVVI